MRILSFIVLLFALYFTNRLTQSPHGSDFKIACKTCHSPKGWELDKSVYSFNHNDTRLPLLGQHNSIDCRECHKSLVFNEAKITCFDCHADMHQSTVGNDCSRCHNQNSWLVNNINQIHQMSRFPLLGAHRTADCSQCHTSESLLKYDAIGVNCVDCHRTEYLDTTNPNHLKSGMSEECVSCHSINSLQWTGGSFNHDAFPLVQGHSATRCIDCHTTGSYSAVSKDCYSCHQNDFASAKSPDHVSAAFSVTCQNCHTLAQGWSPAAFDHSGFPLTSGHSAATCIDCHKNGNYGTISKDCYSCHQANYQSTTNPNHVLSGFSTACQTCHSTTPGWKPATFNHASFPLTLGHSGQSCVDCHKNGNYTSTPTDCYSCHQQNYTSTTNPNHTSAGFPTSCLTCHTTNPGWKPAAFNHTSFPLTLGHSSASCADCHTDGNYSNTPSDCYSCHQTDYSNSINPNHASLSFSTTCTQCHTTVSGWKPATFTQHDVLFPIYSGNHKGEWNACSDCHNNSASYAVFNCISCHSNEHTGKNYTNAQCYSCHPRGD